MAAAKKTKPEVETFCLTLAYTGARISEALALTSARVDMAAQTIVFECLKKRQRGVYRAVPVPHELLNRLEEVHQISSGYDKCLWPWGRTKAWLNVKDVMRQASIPAAWAMPKALRHGFGVSGIAEANVPLNMMRKWLGHSRIETTAIYTNAVGCEEIWIASRMWK